MIHLLVEIRQQNRDILHQFSQLRQDVLDISERVALLEAPAAQAARAPQVLPLILPRLPAESLQELEAAEAAVKEKGVAKALVVIAFYILGCPYQCVLIYSFLMLHCRGKGSGNRECIICVTAW